MLLLRTVYPPARVLRLLAGGEGLFSCSASGVGSRGCVADLNMPSDGVGEVVALEVGVTGGVEVGGVDSVGDAKPGVQSAEWMAGAEAGDVANKAVMKPGGWRGEHIRDGFTAEPLLAEAR